MSATTRVGRVTGGSAGLGAALCSELAARGWHVLAPPGEAYNLVSQARRLGLSTEEAHGQIDQLVDVMRHWRDSFLACGVSIKDINYIAPAILPECFFFERQP